MAPLSLPTSLLKKNFKNSPTLIHVIIVKFVSPLMVS